MGYGRYVDEDHNLISTVESALSNALSALDEALQAVTELRDRNPDKEVQIIELRDDLYGLYSDIENADFGADIHDMFQAERGENYWEAS